MRRLLRIFRAQLSRPSTVADRAVPLGVVLGIGLVVAWMHFLLAPGQLEAADDLRWRLIAFVLASARACVALLCWLSPLFVLPWANRTRGVRLPFAALGACVLVAWLVGGEIAPRLAVEALRLGDEAANEHGREFGLGATTRMRHDNPNHWTSTDFAANLAAGLNTETARQQVAGVLASALRLCLPFLALAGARRMRWPAWLVLLFGLSTTLSGLGILMLASAVSGTITAGAELATVMPYAVLGLGAWSLKRSLGREPAWWIRGGRPRRPVLFSAQLACTAVVTSALLFAALSSLAGDPARLLPPVNAVGADITALKVETLDGVAVPLAEFEGNVLAISYWATWCQPCRAELPHLQSMQEQLREQGFRVLAVNGDDEDAATIRGFQSETGLDLELVVPVGEVSRRLRPQGLPTLLLVDRKGIVRVRHVGYHESMDEGLKREVEFLLGESSP